MTLTDLVPSGALADDGQFSAFQDAATEMRAAHQGTVLVPLTHLSRLRADGDDAATFLHNLLTQDVKGLPADGVRQAGFCTPKGRLLATFTLWREGGATLLQLPKALAEPMRKKLSMYVLRSKVTLSDVSDARPALGLAGTQAVAALQAAGLGVPAQVMTQATTGDVNVLCLAADRFEIVLPADGLEALWAQLSGRTRRSAGRPSAGE